MSIKTFKPTTPSRRQMTVSGFDGIDKKAKPEPSLTTSLKKSSGRNSYGRITVRHRGGGNKRKYRIIDFKRDKAGTATVLRLEYDPNRSANIALLEYEDGERRYILAPVGLNAGDKVEAGPQADIKVGNALPRQYPRRYHHPQRGAASRQRRQMVRSAGTAAQLMAKESGDAQIRMPPVRSASCVPTATPPSARWATSSMRTSTSARRPEAPHGWRPTVRGSVMNPNDHPHGGGEGRAPVGRPGPVTPWGKPALATRPARARTPPISSSSSAATRSKEASQYEQIHQKRPVCCP